MSSERPTTLARFDGFIFVVAEYNRSLTGPLKKMHWTKRTTSGIESLSLRPAMVESAPDGIAAIVR